MATDNTQVGQASSAGDLIRDIWRAATGAKTQVVQLDFGGAGTNPEELVTSDNRLPTAAQLYGVSTADGSLVALKCLPDGRLAVSPSLVLDPVTLTLLSDATVAAPATGWQAWPKGFASLAFSAYFLVGSGALAAELVLLGNHTATLAGAVVLSTLDLTDSSGPQGDSIKQAWPFICVQLTSISGTNAAVNANVSFL